MYKDLMIIHGGIDCGNDKILDDTWLYNFLNGQWLKFESDTVVVLRFNHAAVMVNEFMFIIGGLTNSNHNKQKKSNRKETHNNSNSSFVICISTNCVIAKDTF